MIILSYFPIFGISPVLAQEPVIKNFVSDASDISASVKSRMDSNNEPCALVKIQVVYKVVVVEGTPLIGELQCVFHLMNPGTSSITGPM